MSKYFCSESRTVHESFASVGELIRNDFYSSPDEPSNCFRGQILCSHLHLFFHLLAHWFLCVISSRPQAASQTPHRENWSRRRTHTCTHTPVSTAGVYWFRTLCRVHRLQENEVLMKSTAIISRGRSAERWICIWWRHLFCCPKRIYI